MSMPNQLDNRRGIYTPFVIVTKGTLVIMLVLEKFNEFVRVIYNSRWTMVRI